MITLPSAPRTGETSVICNDPSFLRVTKQPRLLFFRNSFASAISIKSQLVSFHPSGFSSHPSSAKRLFHLSAFSFYPFLLLKLDVFGEELNGGLADLLGVVISVSGDGESADCWQQAPESATGDPVHEVDADPL